MYNGKNVLVCGMARSGLASAILLRKLGANVTIQDLKSSDDKNISEFLKDADKYGIDLYLGKNPDDILINFDLIVVSPGIPCNLPFFKKAKQLNIELIGEIELAFRVCPCPVVAITGTNGKTTTTALLGDIFSGFYKGCKTVGNIGIPFTGQVSDMRAEDYIIAEISSFQLETVSLFKPHIATILNLTPDHLNRHKTMENYASIKERIFSNQNGNDYAVINYDDNICKEMANRIKSRLIFFSRKESLKCGVFLENNVICENISGKKRDIISLDAIKIPGTHNIENIMAAIACAVCAKIPVEIIKTSIEAFYGVEHRIEFVREINGVSYYNDSKATNVDSAIKALEAFKQPIILIGGGMDKATDFTKWIKLFDNKVKHLLIIGETSNQIIETCEKQKFYNYSKSETLSDAVKKCHDLAKKGDCVLLSPACASFDMFESYEHRGNLFKEYVSLL